MNFKLLAISVVAAIVAIAGIALVLSFVAGDSLRAAIVAGAVTLFIWMTFPKRENATPRWFTLFLLAMAFSSIIPASMSLIIQGVAVVIAYVAWFTRKESRRGSAVFGWATIVLVYWALLMFHPNIPGLNVGLLGFRKTVFCLVGLLIGVAMNSTVARTAERTAIRVLALSVFVSVALHLLAPQLEALLVKRDADIYTGLFEGQARLQGVYAGPFHAATAGLILAVWGIARFRQRRLESVFMIVLGGSAIYFSLVRTAYVALAVALLAWLFASPTTSRFLRRTALALLVGGGAFFVIATVSPSSLSFLDAIVNFAHDSRFLGRVDGYQEGLDALASSPVFGWGSGSAGDTLGAAFTGGQFHVTPHNVALKIVVEGGLVGFALWACMIIATFRSMPRSSDSTPVAAGVLGLMLGMGLTGSSLEALPPTFFAFLIVGLAVQPKPAELRPELSEPLPALALR